MLAARCGREEGEANYLKYEREKTTDAAGTVTRLPAHHLVYYQGDGALVEPDPDPAAQARKKKDPKLDPEPSPAIESPMYLVVSGASLGEQRGRSALVAPPDRTNAYHNRIAANHHILVLGGAPGASGAGSGSRCPPGGSSSLSSPPSRSCYSWLACAGRLRLVARNVMTEALERWRHLILQAWERE